MLGTELRGVVVKFVRRTDKASVAESAARAKASTRYLGLATDTPNYLSDSLSPKRRRLLARDRQIKKVKGYYYVWLLNRNILLRKEEGSSVLERMTQAELGKL